MFDIPTFHVSDLAKDDWPRGPEWAGRRALIGQRAVIHLASPGPRACPRLGLLLHSRSRPRGVQRVKLPQRRTTRPHEEPRSAAASDPRHAHTHAEITRIKQTHEARTPRRTSHSINIVLNPTQPLNRTEPHAAASRNFRLLVQ